MHMTIEGNVMLANSYTSSSAGCQQPAIHFIVVTPRSLDADSLLIASYTTNHGVPTPPSEQKQQHRQQQELEKGTKRD